MREKNPEFCLPPTYHSPTRHLHGLDSARSQETWRMSFTDYSANYTEQSREGTGSGSQCRDGGTDGPLTCCATVFTLTCENGATKFESLLIGL